MYNRTWNRFEDTQCDVIHIPTPGLNKIGKNGHIIKNVPNAHNIDALVIYLYSCQSGWFTFFIHTYVAMLESRYKWHVAGFFFTFFKNAQLWSLIFLHIMLGKTMPCAFSIHDIFRSKKRSRRSMYVEVERETLLNGLSKLRRQVPLNYVGLG
jgi:hypothetical protein